MSRLPHIAALSLLASCASSTGPDGRKPPEVETIGQHPFGDLGHVAAEIDGDHRYFGVSMIDADYGVAVGKNGMHIIELDGAREVSSVDTDTLGYRVDYDPSLQIAWMGEPKKARLVKYDLSDLDNMVAMADYEGPLELTEHLSAFEGRVLVGTEGKALLIDADMQLLATFETESSHGVGLYQDRAVIASVDTLMLWDVSKPTDPVLIDEQSLPDQGWDVAFDGARVAVSMGSSGIELFTAGDSLVPLGHLSLPRSNYDLAIDGDDLWIAGWSGTWLADLSADPPVLLAEDPALAYSWTIDAGWGRALVGEFDIAHVLERLPGGGPEVTVTDTVMIAAEGPQWESFEVRNDGRDDLQLVFEPRGSLTSVLELTLAPGGRQQVDVVLTGPVEKASLKWSSNDPDEPVGVVELLAADDVVGLPHPAFESTVFTYPSEDQAPITQADFLGKVTFLNFFRTT